MNTKEEKRNELELRMYFFVPYNISPIQQGIQSGHALGRYALKYGRYDPNHIVWDFLEKYETWIILNGGTTNDTRDFNSIPVGSLNLIGDQLQNNDIEFSYFIEPDLNNALTAISIICDERVFNYEDFPPFPEWVHSQEIEPRTQQFIDRAFIAPTSSDEECQRILPDYYVRWLKEVLGGEKNFFLRTLLKGKKLA